MKNAGVYLLEQTGAKLPGLEDNLGESKSGTNGFCDLPEKFAHARMPTKESLCLCHLFFHVCAQISMLIDVKYYRYVVRP